MQPARATQHTQLQAPHEHNSGWNRYSSFALIRGQKRFSPLLAISGTGQLWDFWDSFRRLNNSDPRMTRLQETQTNPGEHTIQEEGGFSDGSLSSKNYPRHDVTTDHRYSFCFASAPRGA